MLVLVTGATGFLGREVVRELLDRHHEVRCLVHSPGREQFFSDRVVDACVGDISDPNSLAPGFSRAEAVIHLVAVIRERRGATFDQINRQGTANVVAAAQANGVKHFVHVSAIGAANNPGYSYLHSKWLGEQEVVKGGVPYTIIRPSIIFGEGDEFLNTLAALVRVSPLVPVAGSGRTQFQPIDVADVARCVVLALGREELRGKLIEIGGPQQLTYNDLIRIVARTLGKRRLRVHVPLGLMHIVAAVLEKVQPRPAVTIEQLRMISIPNVARLGSVEQTFGFTPRPMEGNIDFVKSVSLVDGLKIMSGFMPSRIRDH